MKVIGLAHPTRAPTGLFLVMMASATMAAIGMVIAAGLNTTTAGTTSGTGILTATAIRRAVGIGLFVPRGEHNARAAEWPSAARETLTSLHARNCVQSQFVSSSLPRLSHQMILSPLYRLNFSSGVTTGMFSAKA